MEKKKKKKKPWKLIERPYTSAHVHTPASGCSQAVFRVHTRHPYARASLHAIVGTGEKRLTSSLVRRAPPTTALVRRNPMIRGGRWFSYSRSSSEFLQSAPGTKKRKKKKGTFCLLWQRMCIYLSCCDFHSHCVGLNRMQNPLLLLYDLCKLNVLLKSYNL